MKLLRILFFLLLSITVNAQLFLNPYSSASSVTDGAALWINTANTSTMFQEGGGGGGNPVTAVTANGNPVGCIYDQSVNALLLRAAASAGQWPVLGSDGTRNGYLTFDGTNDRIVVQNTPILNNLHSASPSFSLYFWIKFNGGDAANQIVFTSNNNGTGTGWSLFKNTSNKLVWNTWVATVNKSTRTSTVSVTAATGWIPVIVSINGTGTGTGRMVIGEVEDATFDVSAGSAVDATGGMWIGSRSSLVQWLNGSIGDILILPGPATAARIAAYKAYNPTRISTEFTPRIQVKFDFNDATKLFSNSAGTTPVVADAVVRYVSGGNTETLGTCNRTLSSTSDASAPIYRTNVVNGLSALEFDGTDDNLDFAQTLCGELGGKWTMFIICRNRTPATGSHIISCDNASGRYLALTGEGYDILGSFPNPYFAVHTSDPAGSMVIETPDLTDAKFKIVAMRRDGLEIKIWGGEKDSFIDSTDGAISFTDMGIQYDDPTFTAWRLNGFVAYLEKWNGKLSDTEVPARIDELNVLYNIVP